MVPLFGPRQCRVCNCHKYRVEEGIQKVHAQVGGIRRQNMSGQTMTWTNIYVIMLPLSMLQQATTCLCNSNLYILYQRRRSYYWVPISIVSFARISCISNPNLKRKLYWLNLSMFVFMLVSIRWQVGQVSCVSSVHLYSNFKPRKK